MRTWLALLVAGITLLLDSSDSDSGDSGSGASDSAGSGSSGSGNAVAEIADIAVAADDHTTSGYGTSGSAQRRGQPGAGGDDELGDIPPAE